MRKKILPAALAMMLTISTVLSPTGSFLSYAAEQNTSIENLKVSNQINPLGIDEVPEFSWGIESNILGFKQSAYEITVMDSNGAEVWNSGRVRSSQSQDIKLEADLEAQSRYNWKVKVWDTQGNVYESLGDNYFETGLQTDDWKDSNWEGAQWIGTTDLELSTDIPVFTINYRMQIEQGTTKAGFIFGANDFRLTEPIYNNYLVAGENYIYYEVDLTELTEGNGSAKLNVYRKGYGEADYDQPDNRSLLASVDIGALNEENMYDQHTYQINCTGHRATFLVDGTTVSNNLILNPSGLTGDTPSFPRLNEIGFGVPEGKAIFTNVTVQHNRHGSVLFGADVGATYDIFQGLEGVNIPRYSSNIEVSNIEAVYASPAYGSVPYMRKEIETDAGKEIESVQLYASSRGIYEFYANGQRVGEEYFNPGHRQYDVSNTYNTYDLTDLFVNGENAVGAVLSSGWFSDHMSFTIGNYNYYGDEYTLLAKLQVNYTDGNSDVYVTDNSWKVGTDGPVRWSSLFDGEFYDATKEAGMEGWSTIEYDAGSWKAAEVIPAVSEDIENAKLYSAIGQQVTIYETIDAEYAGEETRDGQTVYIYDMGTNLVGVPQITLPEMEEGEIMTIRYAEYRYPDLDEDNTYYYGELSNLILTENYREALSTDRYVSNGNDAGVIYMPSYTFHGYQYIELSHYIPAENIKGAAMSSIQDITASYEVESDKVVDGNNIGDLANQLYDNIVRSTLGNHLSIPTDCNQRNERMGWTGDAQVFSRTAVSVADVNQFYANWMQIARDTQSTVNGGYSSTIPAIKGSMTSGSMGLSWASAGIMVPYQTYMQYGDTTVIEDHLESMLWYIETNLAGRASGCEYLTNSSGLAEHLSIASTDSNYCNNPLYYYICNIVAEMAAAIGEDEIAEEYSTLAANIKREFNEKMINADGYPTTIAGAVQHSQAAYALALFYGIVDEESTDVYDKFLENFVDICSSEYYYSSKDVTIPAYGITTGFVGTAPLLPALTKAGLTDTAYNMFEQTEYASWLYPITQGATSIWERWDSYTHEAGFGGNNGMNSFNHYALGGVGAWMIEYQVGIQRDDTAGFDTFILQPAPGGSFTSVSGSFDSVNGTIESSYTAEDGTLISYNTVVPANSTATLYLPIDENTTAGNTPEGVTFLEITEHNGETAAAYALEAGGYEFTLVDGEIEVNVADGYVSTNVSAFRKLLGDTIADAQELMDTDEYENMLESLKAEYEEVLEDAIKLYNNINASDDELFDMWLELSNQMNKLGFQKGDKALLLRMIQAADLLDLSLYQTAGVNDLLDALDDAKAVYADGDAMEDDITEVVEALRKAMNNLRYKANKEVLQKTVVKAQSLILSDYTEESIQAASFRSVLNAALIVLEDDNAEQNDVDAAVISLNNAIDALILKDNASTDDTQDTGEETKDTTGNPTETKDETSDSDSGKGNGKDNTDETKNTSGSGKDNTGNSAAGKTSVKTGDSAPVILVLVGLAMASLVMCVGFRKKIK